MTPDLFSFFFYSLLLPFLISSIIFTITYVHQGLTPDAESYGWLIRSCGHRDLLVEGLQLLEEVTEKGNLPYLI